jgi:hypothetical protein
MCVKKHGRYVSKFIFGGEIKKSSASYDTAEEAREEALRMRRRMYDDAYKALIQNETETEIVVGGKKASSESDEDNSTVCV